MKSVNPFDMARGYLNYFLQKAQDSLAEEPLGRLKELMPNYERSLRIRIVSRSGLGNEAEKAERRRTIYEKLFKKSRLLQLTAAEAETLVMMLNFYADAEALLEALND